MDIYERRALGKKGHVVLPEMVRNIIGAEEGDYIAFVSIDKDDGNNDSYILKIRVVKQMGEP